MNISLIFLVLGFMPGKSINILQSGLIFFTKLQIFLCHSRLLCAPFNLTNLV